MTVRPSTEQIERTILGMIRRQPRQHTTSSIVAHWPRTKLHTVRRAIERLESRGDIRLVGMSGELWECSPPKGMQYIPISIFDLPRVMRLVGGR